MSNSTDANGAWSIQHARNLHSIHLWGAKYFELNEAGRVLAIRIAMRHHIAT